MAGLQLAERLLDRRLLQGKRGDLGQVQVVGLGQPAQVVEVGHAKDVEVAEGPVLGGGQQGRSGGPGRQRGVERLKEVSGTGAVL